MQWLHYACSKMQQKWVMMLQISIREETGSLLILMNSAPHTYHPWHYRKTDTSTFHHGTGILLWLGRFSLSGGFPLSSQHDSEGNWVSHQGKQRAHAHFFFSYWFTTLLLHWLNPDTNPKYKAIHPEALKILYFCCQPVLNNSGCLRKAKVLWTCPFGLDWERSICKR